MSNKRISSTRQRKRQHVLDVKIRESKERSRRFRTICGFVFKVVIVVGLGVGAWIGGKEGLRRFVWENPDYYIHDIAFTTDGALTREQVLNTASLVEGVNIFSVSLANARTSIEQLPQVESATVQRQFPSTITVTITERRPIAWVAAKGDEDPSSSDKSFLIDARGTVLRSRVILPEYYHLPIISGFETENLVPGKRVNALEMQAALELVKLNADSTRFQARNIDLSKGYCLVVTDQRRAKVTFGLEKVDQQLSRLYRCLDRAEEDHRELQTVNLIVERNIPVTFVEPESDFPADGLPIAEPAGGKPGAIAAGPNEKSTPKPDALKNKPADTSKRTTPAKAAAVKATPTPAAVKRGATFTPARPLKPFRTNP